MKIRITPSAALFLLALFSEQRSLFLATGLAAAVHECGHLLAAFVLKIPIRMLEIDLMGAKIYPKGLIPSYGAEAILAAAGPLFSLLLALPTLPFSSPFAAALQAATLSLALFNLLPIKGFDGGRMLRAPVARCFGEHAAALLLFCTTYASLLLLFSLSACMLLRHGQSAALAVLSASLFAQLLLNLGPSVQTNSKKQAFKSKRENMRA